MTPKSKEELKRLFRQILFAPVHIDHQNIEPDEITIVKEGKEHYLDALADAALSYTQHLYTRQDVKAICEKVVGNDDEIIKKPDKHEEYANLRRKNRNGLRWEQRQSIDSIIDKWGK